MVVEMRTRALGSVGKYYVYRLRYPNNRAVFGVKAGTVFYVGKGKGSRSDEHRAETKSLIRRKAWREMKHKHKVIMDIWQAGHEVIEELVGRSDDEEVALQAEAFQIAMQGIENLTNEK